MEVGEDSSPDRRPYKVTPTVASVTDLFDIETDNWFKSLDRRTVFMRNATCVLHRVFGLSSVDLCKFCCLF